MKQIKEIKIEEGKKNRNNKLRSLNWFKYINN